jgi:hypothetical protein
MIGGKERDTKVASVVYIMAGISFYGNESTTFFFYNAANDSFHLPR